MFRSKKRIKELEEKISSLETVITELKDYSDSLELELSRKDKKIALMEKMMRLDQVRRGIK